MQASTPHSVRLFIPPNDCGKKPFMAPQFPSIQSFFGREPSVRTEKPKVRPSATETGEASSCSPGAPGDGFTASEIDDVLHPAGLPKWNPPKEYPEIDIGALVPGPMCVTIMGRIVNFYDQVNLMKMPRAAKGCLRCVVGDGTGFVVVGLLQCRVVRWVRMNIDSALKGQALVRQNRLQASPRPAGDGMDATYLDCGSGLGHQSRWGCFDYVGLSGEG